MSFWTDFMNTIRGSLRPEPERKEGPAVEWTDAEFDAHLEYARRETRKSTHGKLWKRDGDTLHLTGFPITIRRLSADEQITFSGHFRVECPGYMTAFPSLMDDAKRIGERWAREIDALPLTPNQGRSPAADDSDNRILTPDAETPRRTSHYERGWDAAWEQGEFAGKGMINETPYSPGSDGESEFFEGYYDGLAVRDNLEDPRRRENGNDPLTPDYDPKRGRRG